MNFRNIMKVSIIAIFALALCCQRIDASTLSRAAGYCYTTDYMKTQWEHFTSKTAYMVARGTNFASLVPIPSCKPVKFWLLSRHGTRLPEDDQIQDLPNLEALRDSIVKNYKKDVPGGLCSQDLQLIKNWVLDTNITVDKAQYLTVQGWNDLKIMAQEFKKGLPELLSNYNENRFLFRHTDTQRTEGSYKAFVEGLFGVNAYQSTKAIKGTDRDALLAPFDACPSWVEREANKKGDGTEAGTFKKSPTMVEALERISARLGFSKPLKYKQVKQLWDICRFETGWYLDKPSAWCTPFTMEDVLVFEYSDDLGKEHANGYTTEMNKNIACETVKDLLKRLNSNAEPSVTAYFSHSALIQLFGTALGMQKGSTLLKSSTYSSEANRAWRTSEMDPLAANFAVVKYDCSADKNDPSPKIAFFNNQKRIGFGGCPGGICKLADFTKTYEKFLNVHCPAVYCTETQL